MRAESHYVDLLDARTSDARDQAGRGRATETETDAPARGTSPSLAYTDPTLHAGRDLAHALTTLAACADLLNGSPSDLSRNVVGNLVRAEAWRASSLLHATRVIRQELPVARTAVSVLSVLDQVVQGFAAERRVRPIVIESETELPYGSIMGGDEKLLVGALSSAVMATLSLVEQVPSARVVVSAAVEGTTLTFAVTQNVVIPPGQWQARSFDPNWTDRIGGIPSLVAMLSLRETAAAHGGNATASVEGRGTRIALHLPIGV